MSNGPDLMPGLLDRCLKDDANLVAVDELFRYRAFYESGDADRRKQFDGEQYCFTLYRQMEFPDRTSQDFQRLWEESVRFDPERRLLKAVYNLTLLDVCYDSLRHANLFGRFVKPRPKLAKMIRESRALQALYEDSALKSRSTTITSPWQYFKDIVRNLLMLAFLSISNPLPIAAFPALFTLPALPDLFVISAISITIALVIGIISSVLRYLAGLPRTPMLQIEDAYSLSILRASHRSLIFHSVIGDLMDEILSRWIGLTSFAFFLSLLNMAMVNYVGSVVFIMALIAVISEGCSFRAIAAIAYLTTTVVYAQVQGLSLIWGFGDILRSLLGHCFPNSPFLSQLTVIDDRRDVLTALVLNMVRIPAVLSLKPWQFADLLLEPCQLLLSAFFWNIALSQGLVSAVIARLIFSLVIHAVLFLLQGPVRFSASEKIHDN